MKGAQGIGKTTGNIKKKIRWHKSVKHNEDQPQKGRLRGKYASSTLPGNKSTSLPSRWWSTGQLIKHVEHVGSIHDGNPGNNWENTFGNKKLQSTNQQNQPNPSKEFIQNRAPDVQIGLLRSPTSPPKLNLLTSVRVRIVSNDTSLP